MKIVINTCYGGFGLSTKAMIELIKRKAKCLTAHDVNSSSVKRWNNDKWVGTGFNDFLMLGYCKEVIKHNDIIYTLNHDSQSRTDSDLVEVVEQMREQANGYCAKLSVVEIPDDVNWYISEYDGSERVEENHRSWN